MSPTKSEECRVIPGAGRLQSAREGFDGTEFPALLVSSGAARHVAGN